MAGKKKAKKKVVGKVAEPEVTVGEGDEVETEVAIAEVPSIKVRSAKRGVVMMTPAEFAVYCKERDAE